MRAGLLAVVLAAILAGTTGCAGGLLFRDVEAIRIVSPTNESTVRVPLTVEFELLDPGLEPAEFGVFIDRNPPPPGEPLDEGDRTGVHLVDRTEVVVDYVPRTDSGSVASRDAHELTVVLFGTDGRRLGEYAEYVSFRVQR